MVLAYLDTWAKLIDEILSLSTSNASDSEVAQKLLGFSPNGSKGKKKRVKYTVFECSLLHQPVQGMLDDDDEDGISAAYINQFLREELPKRLIRLVEVLNTNALRSPWVQPRRFSTSPLSSALYRSNPAGVLTSNDYLGSKLQVLCKIIEVLDMTKTSLGRGFSDLTVSGQSWLYQAFALLFSATGEVQSLSVISTLPTRALTSKCLSDWLRRDQNVLRRSKAATSSVSHGLAHMLLRSGIYHELLRPHSEPLAAISTCQDSLFEAEVIYPLQQLLFSVDSSRFSGATKLLDHIISQVNQTDANAIVHLVELLSRDTAIHAKGHADFEGLLAPFSWLMALAHRYHDIYSPESNAHLPELLLLIKELSLKLRFGSSGLCQVGGKWALPAQIDLLNLRLCWSIAIIVGTLETEDPNMGLALQTLQDLTYDDIPPEYQRRNSTSTALYHEFSKSTDKVSTLRILCETFRHESLALVLRYAGQSHPAGSFPGVRKIICHDSSDIVHILKRLVRGNPVEPPDDESESEQDHEYEDSYIDHEDYDSRDPEQFFERYPSESDDGEHENNYSRGWGRDWLAHAGEY
ncbi:glycoside hydrolase family 39 protein [Ceratobasidium sp. AG-Ba]|nr:glycoside hydrolase family 39 protein [Ceratobasidium sp. AG-Ba]